MLRNIVLLDGTWNSEASKTNVLKLSREAAVLRKLILDRHDGVEQRVEYFTGVGTDGPLLERLLGGAIGLGLKQIVQNAYDWLVDNYESDQELYIFGFSRGAYAARALAGLIGASGIQRRKDPGLFDISWENYRARKDARKERRAEARGSRLRLRTPAFEKAHERGEIHSNNRVEFLGVWDTVGSYGVPAGIGLAPLARYVSLALLGFQDTKFGDHIAHGVHAIGVDERRRPFTPTFWTIDKGEPQPANVEQTWFAGVHCNVGGGYADAGLSDLALAWMIARARALTKLGFDISAAKVALRPDIDGEVYDSAKGWVVDQLFPRSRPMFSPDALGHGYFTNAGDPKEEHINERVHWSVLAKLGRPCTVYDVAKTPYDPPNLPAEFKALGPAPQPGVAARIAAPTAEELELMPPALAALVPRFARG